MESMLKEFLTMSYRILFCTLIRFLGGVVSTFHYRVLLLTRLVINQIYPRHYVSQDPMVEVLFIYLDSLMVIHTDINSTKNVKTTS